MSETISTSKEYLVALGRITVNMNHLEQWTKVYLGQLLDSNYEFVWQRYSTERYGKILEIFDLAFQCKISDKVLKDEFSVILKKLSSLYQKRNTYIHSWWIFAEDDSFTLRTKFLKYPKVDQEDNPSISELNQFADDLRSSAEELSVFINKVAPFKKPTTA
jgi:hypothetical protein